MKEILFKQLKDKIIPKEIVGNASVISKEGMANDTELIDNDKTVYVIDADSNAEDLNSVFKLAGRLHTSKVIVIGSQEMNYYFGGKRHFYKVKEI